jgi:3-dehydroquinate dehydratase-1
MSAKGVISRFSGEVFGSSMTFGSSAGDPLRGQVPVEQLQNVCEFFINRSDGRDVANINE